MVWLFYKALFCLVCLSCWSGLPAVQAFVAPTTTAYRTTTTTTTFPPRRRRVFGLVAQVSSSPSTTTTLDFEFALLFDCDGVILETEELHRLAYNAAFAEFQLAVDGIPVEWSVRTASKSHTYTHTHRGRGHEDCQEKKGQPCIWHGDGTTIDV